MPNRLNISPSIWQSYINAILECLQSRKHCEAIMDILLLLLCKAVLSLCVECLGVNLLHVFICTAIHNSLSSGSLFFASLRQNN